jgi:hypothetical protein
VVGVADLLTGLDDATALLHAIDATAIRAGTGNLPEA